MLTRYTVFRPDGTRSDHEIDWPEEPGYDAISALVRPLLDGQPLEHVFVLHNGARRDLFVDEEGAMNGLPRNEAATAIYRNNWLTRHPGTDPETIPAIYGVAILFPDRIIWM